MYTGIKSWITAIKITSVDENRKPELDQLADYIREKHVRGETAHLNFVCTHNSRRSQLGQVWAAVMGHYFQVSVKTYSGGMETTAFNPRAVESLRRFGFKITGEDTENPKYKVHFSENLAPLICFSKLTDDAVNQTEHFAAIMTCSDADENCPFIPGAEIRIPIRYRDPKAYDGTEQESEMYDERSTQIARELYYVFAQINK